MPEIDVLLLVNLPDLMPYQKIEFVQQMEESGWQFLEEGEAFYAAYPGFLRHQEIVAQSERELEQAAEYAGVKGWDAVCLLKDLLEWPAHRLSMAEWRPMTHAQNAHSSAKQSAESAPR